MFYLSGYYNFLIRKLFDLYNFLFSKSYKKNNIINVLDYCSKNIEYYRNKGRDIAEYDVIDKKTLMHNFDSFHRKGLYFKRLSYSSGTTGTPGKFLRDFKSMAAEQYFQNRYFGWKGKYKVVFRGIKLFNVKEPREKIYKVVPLMKEMYVSSFHINNDSLRHLTLKLKKIRNKCLWAYPSSAYQLAEYCLQNSVKLEFDIVATSSEMLYDYQIIAIEKAFNCKIKDWYGLAERTAALCRCQYGHYHEVDNYSFLEYLPFEGTVFKIAGTTLYNKVMPIIRYDPNDLFDISPAACPCGNPGKNITNILGRGSNNISLPYGRLPEILLAYMFRSARNVEEGQIIQRKEKNIVINVVRSPNFSIEDEKLLINSFCNYLPREAFEINYVGKIERDKSGKYSYVINEGRT
jgi:phenylacetate-CoA ligase